MFIIGATAKLQKELNFEIKNHEEFKVNPLKLWTANMFKVSRYKGAIFMNHETRYCVILFRLRKKEFNQLETLFKEQLRQNLTDDGISPSLINQYLDSGNELTFTKTFNRSILGSIKENIYFSECIFATELGIENPNMQYLNHYLNHDMLHMPTKGKRPTSLMNEKLNELYQ